ncbi:heterokaryon incompatibility protein Het-C-domain-containing protein [Paraphysoderma sedebokerense]|nr:heterokaryon incompatibility protein Het-C-domain-containing protein [Paraphysoderma sedebokerense]
MTFKTISRVSLLCLQLFLTTQLVSAFLAGQGNIHTKFPLYTHLSILHESLCPPHNSTSSKFYDPPTCRAIYFGNLMRDLSQLSNPSTASKLSEKNVIRIVSFVSKWVYGYREKEYQVTADILGHYDSVQHMDNPTPIPGEKGNPPRRIQQRELGIHPTKFIKNFIMPRSTSLYYDSPYPTTFTYIRQTLFSSLSDYVQSLQYANQSPPQKSHKNAALFKIGSIFHSLEDFFSHSNWVELAIHELTDYSYNSVFPWVGNNTGVPCRTFPTAPTSKKRNEICYPLVTGKVTGTTGELKISLLTAIKARLSSFLRFQSQSKSTARNHTLSRIFKNPDGLFDPEHDTAVMMDLSEKHDQQQARMFHIQKRSGDESKQKSIKELLVTPVVKFLTSTITKLKVKATKSTGLFEPKGNGTNPTHLEMNKDGNENFVHEISGRCASLAVRLLVKRIMNRVENALSHPSLTNNKDTKKLLSVVKTWLNQDTVRSKLDGGLIGYESSKKATNTLFKRHI